jgi:Rrf2 family protein
MLTSKTKYALKALLALAAKERSTPVLIAALAEEEGIPRKFLERILLELKALGLVQSKKGKGGGYLLKGQPEDIMLGHVVRAFDGPLAPIACVSVTAYARCKECKDEDGCALRVTMKEVRDVTARILDNTSLADALARVGRRRPAMYHI